MKELEYDVLVIGAGPGGSTAARYAAKNGVDVLLIEKRQEIGSPVRCGEGIAKIWLEEIDIEPNKKWIANEVKGARIYSPSGFVAHLTEKYAGNEVGYVVDRDIFDKDLAYAAARDGADVMVKTSATDVIKENNKIVGIKARHLGEDIIIKSKIFIAADGFESQIPRWAGLDTRLKPNDVNVCYQYTLAGVDVDTDYNDFYLGSCAPGGYVWIFPKGDGIANVGIGVQLSKIPRGERGYAKKLLDKFIDRHENLKKGSPIREVAGAVSVSQPLEKTILHRFMVVGDSARMIDPLTGGGVANACYAGMCAGEVAAKCIKEDNVKESALQEYEMRWREKIEEQMYRNWVAKEKLVHLNDDVFDKLIELVEDANLEKITTFQILKLVQEKYPELVKEFEDLL